MIDFIKNIFVYPVSELFLKIDMYFNPEEIDNLKRPEQDSEFSLYSK